MKITREVKTAILVIGSILLFFWGYSFLKGKNLFDTTRKFYVVYDNVEGLAPSAAVTINGLTVGKVNTITIQEKTGKLLVEIQMDNEVPVAKSSTASIYEPGFIGGKQIAINPNFEDTNYAKSGDYLQPKVILGLTASLEKNLAPIQEKLDKVLANADALLVNLNDVLDANTKSNLKKTIAELNTTMTNFSSVSGNLDKVVADNKEKLGSVVTNLDKTTGNFAKISEDLEKAKLGATVENLEKTLVSVNKMMADMESGKGTMGKLMKDEAMYNNLTKASKEIELLLQDLRLHPTRYVNVSLFGKKEKPYTAPAEEPKK
ncbi:MlaD family protein [Flavobacterium saliperosum]|uniref:Phospholipid/cholesterol/gamma-HCH transport system substrate-binding protein n=1 Tax=Flavobacterium saliperosum TaxID=329186 RepID=A0A1G4VJY8_9FLAO|nr:MlaD family protein [Flavobacterium saliperosum]SCX07873.1 phospholipid/cholesterol/gamma-HCH transport system substrate-binding protein [Flavobacterium saliperosum]